ncbi:hypothetical protein M433DRAFT_338546 [Acidomyces richmondensis BFW]|nr:MAG: hypothetical protein FE78DRAFT_507823 [Acidomyces sp. 'richmondensis']KYG49194.1 hypothetical protein M433DRAFT_338546 [Acidomyces richmondensis BFW]
MNEAPNIGKTATIDKKKLDIPENVEADDKEQLMKALAAQQNATGLFAKASALKDKAEKCLNPKERQRMLQEAYDREIEAHGQSKIARRMQSGVWQGGIGGAGIGGGVGVGLGTVVGTLVGGVVSVPTTALGGLVGMGVGGIHGPFIKLNQKKAHDVVDREKAAVTNDRDGEAEICQAGSETTERKLQRQHSGPSGSRSQGAEVAAKRPSEKPRKKPRKLEIRSGCKTAPKTQKTPN